MIDRKLNDTLRCRRILPDYTDLASCAPAHSGLRIPNASFIVKFSSNRVQNYEISISRQWAFMHTACYFKEVTI